MINDNVPLPYITKAMKNNLDVSFETFHDDWTGLLVFPVRQYSDENMFSDDIPLQEKNILEYIHFEHRENLTIPNYYFCNQKYPTDGGFNGAGYDKLVNDLQLASISNGYRINKNGNRTLKNSEVGARRLSCKRCQSYRGQVAARQSEKYRKESFNNNKRNDRRLKDPTDPSKKMKLTRRRDTSLSMIKSELCPFKLLLSYDDLGFFVLNGRGNNIHKYHSKNVSERPKIPTTLMSEEEKDIARPMFQSGCTIEMIQNTLFVNFDRILSKSSLRYVKDMYKLVKEYKNLLMDIFIL